MDLPSRGGRAPGSRANGSFPKGAGRLSEKSPAGYPPPHHRDDTPGSAGVPPACCPFGCRSVSLRCCSRPPCRREPHGPGRSRGRAPLPVDSGEGGGRSCGRICRDARAPGFPPMTGSHQRDKSAGILAPVVVEGGPSVVSPCSFVSIRGSSSLTPKLAHQFPKGTGRLSEKSPAGYPPPHHRDDTPGSAGVPPACCPFGCRSVSLRCCSRPPCRREPHGPGRSRGRAPLPVDSGEGGGRSCGRICAGGTPALPGGLPPMTGSHQRDKSAEAFWRQLSLKEVHQSSCLT